MKASTQSPAVPIYLVLFPIAALLVTEVILALLTQAEIAPFPTPLRPALWAELAARLQFLALAILYILLGFGAVYKFLTDLNRLDAQSRRRVVLIFVLSLITGAAAFILINWGLDLEFATDWARSCPERC